MRHTKSVASVAVSLAFLCLLTVQAFATILWAGGEDLDVTLIGTSNVDATSGHFRSTYARYALQARNQDNSVSDPPNGRIQSPNFAATTQFWFHAEYYAPQNTTSSGQQLICLKDAAGVCRLTIRGTGSAGQVKISKRNAAGTFTDLVTCTASMMPINGIGKLDWFNNYNTSGTSTLYWNGVQNCTYSGDTTTDSATQLASFYLAQAWVNVGNDAWSEIIVSTTDTRDMNLFTCAPQANGTTQTWTGTASNVNPTSITDTASINTTSTNQFANFTCPSLVSGTFTVPAVISNARVTVTGSGPANFRYSTRPAGASADYDSGADIVASGVFTNGTPYIWTTNPDTSAAWTTGGLGAGVNFGIKSRP